MASWIPDSIQTQSLLAFLRVRQAGRRLGLKEDLLRTNLDKMEALLPELTPDVNKMRAADWVGAGAGAGVRVLVGVL